MADPILERLNLLRERPAMYIGGYSAEKLFQYLVGYRDALQDHTVKVMSRYEAFIERLYTKYGYGGGGHSWAYVLGQVAGSDAAALDLFFAELDLFQQEYI